MAGALRPVSPRDDVFGLPGGTALRGARVRRLPRHGQERESPAGRGFRKRLRLSAGGLADQLLATDVRRNSSRTHSSIMRFS